MKFYWTVLLSAISFVSVSGQQESFKDAGSLLKKLSEASADTSRILLKTRLSEAYRGNNPDTSYILANQALSAAKEIGFAKGEIHALIALCVLYREKGDLPYALELGLKALKLSEVNRYSYEIIYSQVRIAAVYLAVGDAPKAIIYLKKANEILKNNYDDFQWAVVQYFLGDAYEQRNDLGSAEKTVQMLEQKFGTDPTWIILNTRLRAAIAVKRKNLPQAIEYYRESNSYAIARSAFREAATSSNAIADVFKKMNQPDSAIHYAKEALKYGEMLSYKSRVAVASSILAELYAEKDPQQAVKYYQIASAAKDSVYGVRKIQQLQAATIKEQERQTELEMERLANLNKMRQYALLAGAGVFLILAIVLYSNNRIRRKANQLLHKQKEALQVTLAELKSTQAQLVQSEKMASLGELTAGIAHEIQNPLNFVNNFSEVNNELIRELKIEKLKVKNERDDQLEDDLLSDIAQNLEKINHHGKRADAIVKGMLLHSRGTGVTKEPTDINKLAEEYFRLSYQGLRARDQDFNATLQTDFDVAVGKISVIPPDIGRVLLNLYSNAFYAVNKRKNQETGGYEPTVSVSTKRKNGTVEITVRDNGNGIPQKIIDKIFQPFFTTKPAGIGTGLGLSLSYDIVKAHGGEIRVESTEGLFTVFTLALPV